MNGIAKIIAGKIDVPFLPERGEVWVVEAVLDLISPALDKILPDGWSTVIEDVADGIDESEVASYKQKLIREIDDAIQLPESLEWIDDILIDAVVDVICLALMKGVKL